MGGNPNNATSDNTALAPAGFGRAGLSDSTDKRWRCVAEGQDICLTKERKRYSPVNSNEQRDTRNLKKINIIASIARSREPPSVITYGNLQQRISRLVLILGT